MQKLKVKLPKLNFKLPKKALDLWNQCTGGCKVVCKKIGRYKKLYRVIAASLIVLLALIITAFAIMVYGFKATDRTTRIVAKIIPFPVAVSNYNVITYNQYLFERDYIHHFYEATKQTSVDLKEIDEQIIKQLIENRIIAFQALRYKVKATDQEVDESIQKIIDQNGGKENVEKVLSDLYGLSLDQFKRLVRTQILRDHLDNKVIARVEARHILVRVDSDATQDKIDAAKTKVDGIAAEIKAGLDFAEAAKKYSEDTGSAEQGGKLDPFAVGEMVDTFSETAFKTSPGQVSDPVRTDFGWHIIKVEGKTGTVEKKYAEWLEDLKNKSLILTLFKV